MRLRDILRVQWRARLLLVILCICSVASARFRQPSEEYAAGRAKLRAAADGPIVIYGYTGHEDASEVALFFQESHFYYLTGHSEPGAALLLIPEMPAVESSAEKSNGEKSANGAREILYLPARDPKEEVWEGPKIGPEIGRAHV